VDGATNFRILWANLQNLKNLTFKNKSIDSNLLEWAKNKLLKRFQDLQKIVWIVKNQLNDLENILIEYQNWLELFLDQIQFTNMWLSIENYNNWYLKLEKKYWETSPFNVFHKRINKYKDDQNLFPKVIHYVKTLFETYKDEHQQKLSWKEITEKDLFEDFKNIKDNLSNIETLIAKK
jgi:hypothetical protein